MAPQNLQEIVQQNLQEIVQQHREKSTEIREKLKSNTSSEYAEIYNRYLLTLDTFDQLLTACSAPEIPQDQLMQTQIRITAYSAWLSHIETRITAFKKNPGAQEDDQNGGKTPPSYKITQSIQHMLTKNSNDSATRDNFRAFMAQNGIQKEENEKNPIEKFKRVNNIRN